VRTVYFSSVIVILALGVQACAGASSAGAGGGALANPSSAEVTTTAADAPLAPAARETSQDVDAPAGQLACRTKSAIDGTSELYLDWNGGTVAKGVLRRVAPSGMVYVDPVKAERYKGAIIADPPESLDLASHAAVVGSQNGKQYMRVGDSNQAWTACE
jgi:hypothetical protein